VNSQIGDKDDAWRYVRTRTDADRRLRGDGPQSDLPHLARDASFQALAQNPVAMAALAQNAPAFQALPQSGGVRHSRSGRRSSVASNGAASAVGTQAAAALAANADSFQVLASQPAAVQAVADHAQAFAALAGHDAAFQVMLQNAQAFAKFAGNPAAFEAAAANAASNSVMASQAASFQSLAADSKAMSALKGDSAFQSLAANARHAPSPRRTPIQSAFNDSYGAIAPMLRHSRRSGNPNVLNAAVTQASALSLSARMLGRPGIGRQCQNFQVLAIATAAVQAADCPTFAAPARCGIR
jgi:hypothetical protein